MINSNGINSNVVKRNQTMIHVELPQDYPHGGGVEAAAKKWGCGIDNVLDLSTGLHPDAEPSWLGAFRFSRQRIGLATADRCGQASGLQRSNRC